MTDSWILAFIKTIAQFYHWNWGSHDERSCHPEKPMQGQRAKKPRVGPWHQNIFQAWKIHHWNEIWTKNEPSTSFMRNIMMVYNPLKRLDAILNIQIWCHTMYLQCVKSFSQQINHRLLCHHSKACRYPTSSLLDIHPGRSPAAARKQHH